jgi:hypothetical protein
LDNIIEEIFGVTPATFAIVTVFWAFLFVFIFGDEMLAGFVTCIIAPISAWLIGKLGIVLFILLVIAIIILALYFLFGYGGGTTVSFYKPIAVPIAANSTSQSYQRASKLAPTILYHGTSTMEAATDILTRNRWIVRSHTPIGIYLSEDFSIAAGYAGASGAIVEVSCHIPAHLILDFYKMNGTSDQILSMGYRLIRNGKIFIALTPSNKSRYYRVEGLHPIRLLDRYQNPIFLNYTT